MENNELMLDRNFLIEQEFQLFGRDLQNRLGKTEFQLSRIEERQR